MTSLHIVHMLKNSQKRCVMWCVFTVSLYHGQGSQRVRLKGVHQVCWKTAHIFNKNVRYVILDFFG
jgi:hypothetical protein